MNELLLGLVGSLIGAAATFLGMLMQGRVQERRDRARIAFEAAIKEFEILNEKAKQERSTVPALLNFIQFNYRVIELIETNNLSKGLPGLYEEARELRKVVDEATRKDQGAARRS